MPLLRGKDSGKILEYSRGGGIPPQDVISVETGNKEMKVWIPASAGMTQKNIIPVKPIIEVFNRGTGIQVL